MAVDGANSPALFAILASKESASRPDSFSCSAASNRARVKRTGDKPGSTRSVKLSFGIDTSMILEEKELTCMYIPS